MQDQKTYTAFVAVLGKHEVTMTNPSIGTVKLSNRGFYRFRELIRNRGVVGKDDTQSDVLCELGACFEAAKRLRACDRNGNLLLLDEGTNIMFVVHPEDRVLLSSFEPVNGKRNKKKQKREKAQASA